MTFGSWADLWDPKLKNSLAAPDFDPSHIIAVSAILSGADPAHWETGQAKLEALKRTSGPSTPTTPTARQLIATARRPSSPADP